MSSRSLVTIGAGIVAAAAVYFTGGAAMYVLAAFSVASTAAGMIMGPDATKSGTLRPDELQINQSAEDATIPVVWGTTRVSANFIYVGFDEFASTAKYDESEGGKGGGGDAQVSGYNYTFPLSYGICMGPIDTLWAVKGSPGLDTMAEFPEGLAFPTGPEIFDVEFSKTQGDKTYTEGGSATFYPGSFTQGDATTTDKNHRGVCWIDFPQYGIDGSPSPRSLLFEITRMPVVTDQAGDAIPFFPVRASSNPLDPEYKDANPAAVAWEVLQNRIWGKGMSVDNLHADSFAEAARYYAAQRIGISTAISNTTLTEFMARLREIFGLLVWWDGEQMRARCMHDRAASYNLRPRLQADDVIGTPQFSRGSTAATFNEIRLEFTNRENNWQQEIATTMDLAHVETIQGIRTQTLDGREIGTRRTAELLAHMMLREIAYPAAVASVKLRRTFSGLQPGSFVEMIWEEWRDTGAATTYWRVAEIEDDDQAGEGIQVTLVEDIYATPQDGVVSIFDVANSTIDSDAPLINSDLVLGDITGARDTGEITPVTIWEPNIAISGGVRTIIVAPTRRVGWVESAALAWSNASEGTTHPLMMVPITSMNGTIGGVMVGTGPTVSRSGGEFTILMHRPADAQRMADATGDVQATTDDWDVLTKQYRALLLIGNEIFRVGHATVDTPGVVTVRVYMRGQVGTLQEAHSAGDGCCFFTTLAPSLLTPADGMPITTAVNLHVTPQTNRQAAVTPTTTPGGAGIILGGNSIRPFPPEIYSATKVGTTWVVKLRPRVWWGGAGYQPSIADDCAALVTDLTGLSLRFQKSTGGNIVTIPAASYGSPPFTMPPDIAVTTMLWVPDNDSATGGLLTATIAFDINPASLNVWAVRSSYPSATPTVILQP